MNDQEKKALDKSTHDAQSILSDPLKTKRLLERVVNKSDKNESFFDGIWEDLQAMVRMVRSWRAGDYQDISKKSILIVAGAFLYLVNPLDIIPDFTPLLGMVDDVTVIGYVINNLRKEIQKFKDWEDSTPIVDVEEVEIA